MIFDYVVVQNTEDENGKNVEEIISEGRVVAKDRETALLHVGADLGTENIDDSVQVFLRPF
jgi:hypothetical protein